MTTEKLPSVYFNFLLCKMQTIRHFIGLLGELNQCVCVKHLEECLAQGKDHVQVHYSCCSSLLLNACVPCSPAHVWMHGLPQCCPAQGTVCHPSVCTHKRRQTAFTLVGVHDLISYLGYPPTPAKASQLGLPNPVGYMQETLS